MIQAVSDFISKVTRGEKIRAGGKDAQWKKVSELTPGMMIAVPKSLPRDFDSLPTLSDVESTSLPTCPPKLEERRREADATTAEADIADIDSSDVAWDEIVSIRHLSPERVYDIEVEDTHNFIAGHYVNRRTHSVIPSEGMHRPVRPEVEESLAHASDADTRSEILRRAGLAQDDIVYGGIVAHNTYISANLGIIASLKSGLVNTQQLVAGSAQFISANISSLLANTLTVSEKITSPVVETDTLRAQNITANGTATFGDIIVKGNEGQTVASIDASGNVHTEGDIRARNATFSGTLTLGSGLKGPKGLTPALDIRGDATISGNAAIAGDATVSGTLYAGIIESQTITGLQSSFGNLLNQFGSLQNQLATISATPTNLQPTTYNLQPSSTPPPEADQPWAGTLTPTISSEQESSASAALISELPSHLSSVASLRDRIDAFEASIRGFGTTPEATTTVEVPKDLVIETLSVTGETSLADTTVAGSLMIDAGIVIENSSIVALTNTLNLASFDTISFFGGKLIVDKAGNLTVEGTLIAKGGIETNTIKPIGKDLTIDLSDAVLGASTSSVPSEFGKLLITGLGGSPVASISATGDATFSGSLTADKLSILKTAYDATLSGIATSALQNIQQFGINAPGVMTQDSAGWAVLPGGSREIIVSNSSITKDSLIYITPSSPTGNKTLFVADKNPGQYFRVAIDGPIPSDIKFNWWIIN